MDSFTTLKALVRQQMRQDRQTYIDPYAIYRGFVVFDGRHWFGTGLARRSRADTVNAELGMEIARGRAVAQIAKEIRRYCERERRWAEGYAVGFERSLLAEAIDRICSTPALSFSKAVLEAKAAFDRQAQQAARAWHVDPNGHAVAAPQTAAQTASEAEKTTASDAAGDLF